MKLKHFLLLFAAILLYFCWKIGFDWRITPWFVLAAITIIFIWAKEKNISKLFWIYFPLLILIPITLTLIFPNIKHPETTGKYLVGTSTFFVNDDFNHRSLPTKIWYPIRPAKTENLYPKSTWHQHPKIISAALSQRSGLPEFMFGHLKRFRAAYKEDLDLNLLESTPLKNLPLIVLSHGRGGIKEFNTFMALELASHGYFVVAPDHIKGALVTVTEEHTIIPFDPKEFGEEKEYSDAEKYQIVQNLGQRWANDISALTATLKKLYPQFAKKKVIVGGHSTGAAAAINYCQKATDCIASIALDAWMKPVNQDILLAGSLKPLLALFGDQDSGDFEPINQERYQQLALSTEALGVFNQAIEIKKARHIDFCDAALLSPYSYLFGQQKGKISTREVMHKINHESLKFINEIQ